ncbi:facilitated trehalose transporter Tret1-like [Contarinia nasturtii]|uniref:facilitated trehalose transporter Tret1-like n=1 Tax=Contarinia nasturtii TaxID=265458 RepID=UPI0012D3784A|nr:facilitated trehalose transporter Tret1-like [Contarinia nasturtii]
MQTKANMEKIAEEVQEVSTFRRILPQILATFAKNLIIFNLGEFFAISSIVISSLNGSCIYLNPDETLLVTPAQTSWLSSFAHIAHPIGSLLSGPICDKIGRRKAILFVTIPLAITWIILGLSHSFPLICVCFAMIGFCMGLKEAPSVTYVSEISEPMVRGPMSIIAVMCYNFGVFIVTGLALTLSWRQIALVCALFPCSCFLAVLFIPESPSWSILNDKQNDAQAALQWLRGWVSPQTIYDEFKRLQSYSDTSSSCKPCSKSAVKCQHPKPTFLDKIKELNRKRSLKPFILISCLHFFYEFCAIIVWQPYIIQVIKAFGVPLNANLTLLINAGLGMPASILLISTVKKLGRRFLYITSSSIVTLCSFGLGIYGYVFCPPGWSSFQDNPEEAPIKYNYIRSVVGDYGYLALALILVMQFATKIGVSGLPHIYVSEVFPLKSRTFLCGIVTANQYVVAAIATKTYYNVETWLSLPGAIIFYGIISLTGLIVMYNILPETEQRSLEDIELHFSDNKKGITDIYISKNSKTIE